MNRRLSAVHKVLLGSLLPLALAATVAACASGSSDSTATTRPDTSATSVPATAESTTTTALPMLTEYDRELAKTATIQNKLAAYLSEKEAPQDDPRMGILFGLRARTQALTCRKALSMDDFALADEAMRQVYTTLNLGRNVAGGSTAQILAEAQEIVATVGAPSDDPEQAAAFLDQFIARLAPLLDEAAAITPTTNPS